MGKQLARVEADARPPGMARCPISLFFVLLICAAPGDSTLPQNALKLRLGRTGMAGNG